MKRAFSHDGINWRGTIIYCNGIGQSTVPGNFAFFHLFSHSKITCCVLNVCDMPDSILETEEQWQRK